MSSVQTLSHSPVDITVSTSEQIIPVSSPSQPQPLHVGSSSSDESSSIPAHLTIPASESNISSLVDAILDVVVPSTENKTSEVEPAPIINIAPSIDTDAISYCSLDGDIDESRIDHIIERFGSTKQPKHILMACRYRWKCQLLTASYTILNFLCRNKIFDFDFSDELEASQLPANIQISLDPLSPIEAYLNDRNFMIKHDPYLRFFSHYLVSIISEIFDDCTSNIHYSKDMTSYAYSFITFYCKTWMIDNKINNKCPMNKNKVDSTTLRKKWLEPLTKSITETQTITDLTILKRYEKIYSYITSYKTHLTQYMCYGRTYDDTQDEDTPTESSVISTSSSSNKSILESLSKRKRKVPSESKSKSISPTTVNRKHKSQYETHSPEFYAIDAPLRMLFPNINNINIETLKQINKTLNYAMTQITTNITSRTSSGMYLYLLYMFIYHTNTFIYLI